MGNKKQQPSGHLIQSEGEFTNIVVIQGNDQVVTAFDKAVGVKCSFDVGNKTQGLLGQTSMRIK